MNENDFYDLIKTHLFEIERTVKDIVDDHGIRDWYSFRKVVYIPTTPLFEEHQDLFYIPVDDDSDQLLLSPTTFFCDFDALGDARANHRLACERLESIFGKSQEKNIPGFLQNRWSFGDSSFEISSSFKGDSAIFSNKLYDNYPELWDVCTFRLDLKHYKDVTTEESHDLESLTRSSVLNISLNECDFVQSYWGSGQGSLRQDRSALYKRFKNSESKDELILWKGQRFIGSFTKKYLSLIPKENARSLRLNRIKEAKGGASSNIELGYANPQNSQGELVWMAILVSDKTSGLDRISKDISRFWNLPLDVCESTNC